jgi:beta-lactam-binding protein with PASTA domain
VAVVPSVTGLSGPEAMLRLAMAGLIGGVVGSQVSETVPRGRVVQSSPAEGEEVPDASNVFLFDSMGPASCGVVPEVAGQDLAAARRLVEEAGYLVVELHRGTPGGPGRASCATGSAGCPGRRSGSCGWRRCRDWTR